MTQPGLGPILVRRRWILGATLFIVSISQLCLAHAPGIQPMGLLKGGVVNFGSSTNQFLSAFCLDQGKLEPPLGSSFGNYRGTIKLTFNNGKTSTYDLGDAKQRDLAFSHFRIEGSGYPDALRFSKIDLKLSKIEFLTTGLAHSGNQTEFEKALKRFGAFQEFTRDLSAPKSASTLVETFSREYDAVQNKIWNNRWHIERSTNSNAKSITFDLVRRNPTRTASQEVINLDGRGDAILVQYGDVNLLIDSGLTSEGFSRIAAKLPKNIKLDVLLTHRDQDHIGNATRILETSKSAGITIENILMSTFQVPPFDDKESAKTDVVKRLLEQLEQRKFQRIDLASPVALFSASDTPTILAMNQESMPQVLREARKDMETGGVIRTLLTAEEQSWLTGLDNNLPLESYQLALSPDLNLTVLQKKAPKSPNESTLVARMVHNGQATLYTGDINEQVMEDLLTLDHSLGGRTARNIALLQFRLSYLKTKDPIGYSELVSLASQTPSRNAMLNAVRDKVSPLLDSDPGFRKRYYGFFNSSYQQGLAANVLKWPHHAWLPRTAKGLQTLRRFIEAVNPETIVFSTAPETTEIRFSPGEFTNPESFVSRLKSGGDALSVWILTRFSDTTRASISNYDGKGVNREFKTALADELTRLVQGPLIYRSDLFANTDVVDLLPQIDRAIPEVRRSIVNRELLERAFPRELGQIRGQNVEKVKAFLRKEFPDRAFVFVVTARDGDVRFLTLKDLESGKGLLNEEIKWTVAGTQLFHRMVR